MTVIFQSTTHKAETSGILKKETKDDLERKWRDHELSRTDDLMKIPDYPVNLTAYRQALRDYPQQPDFPNGARPTL